MLTTTFQYAWRTNKLKIQFKCRDMMRCSFLRREFSKKIQKKMNQLLLIFQLMLNRLFFMLRIMLNRLFLMFHIMINRVFLMLHVMLKCSPSEISETGAKLKLKKRILMLCILKMEQKIIYQIGSPCHSAQFNQIIKKSNKPWIKLLRNAIVIKLKGVAYNQTILASNISI